MFLPDSKLLLPPKPKLVSRRNFILGAPAIIIARPKIITPADAALSGFSTSNFIRLASGLITAAPFTVSGWGYMATAGTAETLWDARNSGGGATQNSFRIRKLSGNTLAAHTNAAVAVGATTVPTATWYHFAGVWSSPTDRKIYLNGTLDGTNATSATPSGVNRCSIGLTDASTASEGAVNHRIAEIGMWSEALSADEIVSLGDGFSPKRVRPTSLIAYLPLIRDVIDYKGNAFAVQGTLTVADHSPVRN